MTAAFWEPGVGERRSQVLADASRNAPSRSSTGRKPDVPAEALSDRIDATAEITRPWPVTARRRRRARQSRAPAVPPARLPGVALLSWPRALSDEIAEASGVPASRIAVLSGPNLSRSLTTVVAASDVGSRRRSRACITPSPPLRPPALWAPRWRALPRTSSRPLSADRRHGTEVLTLDPHHPRPGGDDATGTALGARTRPSRRPVRHQATSSPRVHRDCRVTSPLPPRLRHGLAGPACPGVVEGVASAAPVARSPHQ